MRFWRLILILALTAGSLSGWVYYLLGPTGKVSLVRIPSGSSADAVGQLLYQEGLVSSPRAFALFARLAGKAAVLRSGVWRLRGDGVWNLVDDLAYRAVPAAVQVVFPEGWRAAQYAARLTREGFDGSAFLKLVRDPPGSLKPIYDTGPGLEGYLFPATYDLPLADTPKDLVRAMLLRFHAELSPKVTKGLKELGFTIQQWVVLASMVQAEAANARQMPWIAGVFLNRLKLGMLLQSDPTVAYGLHIPMDQLDTADGDFKIDTPYNTYLYPGLPPGAIGNPGQAALLSVLEARLSDKGGRPYLYFFHTPAGKLYLNRTFEGHLRDLNRYYYPVVP